MSTPHPDVSDQRPKPEETPASEGMPPTAISSLDEATSDGNPAADSPPSPPIDVGTLLGIYRLEARLGAGGMGVVYKALHTKLDKYVAIKVLPAQFTRDPLLVSRFEREMKAVGKVEHPHIVRAMDAGEINGMHFLVMEYVDGLDLARLIALRGPRSVREGCEIVRQAALGLAHAHEHDLVHRDIKPSNLVLAEPRAPSPAMRRPAQVHVKVLDLGLALLQCEAGSGQPGLTITNAQTTMGTPDYMAPEQWENTHAVDGRADLYSLGCTLFFLLTGKAPYDDAAHSTLIHKMAGHSLHAPPRLQTRRPDIPEGSAPSTNGCWPSSRPTVSRPPPNWPKR